MGPCSSNESLLSSGPRDVIGWRAQWIIDADGGFLTTVRKRPNEKRRRWCPVALALPRLS
jgi:hypothetical protein